MAPQTAYNDDMTVGFPGMLARGGVNRVDTGENTAGAVEFGDGLSRIAATERGVEPFAAVGATFAGVALHEHRVPVAGIANYPIKSAVSVLKQGVVWVMVEQAVEVTDPVFVRHTVGAGAEPPGSFRKDLDVNLAVAVPNARFMTRTTAAGLVQLELNIP